MLPSTKVKQNSNTRESKTKRPLDKADQRVPGLWKAKAKIGWWTAQGCKPRRQFVCMSRSTKTWHILVQRERLMCLTWKAAIVYCPYQCRASRRASNSWCWELFHWCWFLPRRWSCSTTMRMCCNPCGHHTHAHTLFTKNKKKNAHKKTHQSLESFGKSLMDVPKIQKVMPRNEKKR